MKRLAVIVPVSPFEPAWVLEESARHLLSLDYGDLDVRIVYVVDRNGASDERGRVLRRAGVEVIERGTTRGKRAGAINDAIKYLREFNPDYIAIFDVDSRPERNFVVECVKALEADDRAYIASSKRYICNPVNTVSKAVEAEYYLINFLLRRSKFRQFNGLIGVLRAKYIMKYGLNEDAITEDADFATRMHAMGYRAILVNSTKLYEQAPTTWRDLINQRKRWYYGGLQLWRYLEAVRRSRDIGFKLSWFLSLTLTYLIVIFLPLLAIAPPLLAYKFGRGWLERFLGLIAHTFALQYSAISAISSFLTGRGVSWDPIRRSR